jgi:hypothetical protein
MSTFVPNYSQKDSVMHFKQIINWQKFKKVLIPLLVIKILFFIYFLFKTDLVIITREMADFGIYQQVIENDSIVIEKQRLFQIVKNEEDRGIIIKVRKRNKAVSVPDEHGTYDNPLVD